MVKCADIANGCCLCIALLLMASLILVTLILLGTMLFLCVEFWVQVYRGNGTSGLISVYKIEGTD
jgi:hypothetical protein